MDPRLCATCTHPAYWHPHGACQWRYSNDAPCPCGGFVEAQPRPRPALRGGVSLSTQILAIEMANPLPDSGARTALEAWVLDMLRTWAQAEDLKPTVRIPPEAQYSGRWRLQLSWEPKA